MSAEHWLFKPRHWDTHFCSPSHFILCIFTCVCISFLGCVSPFFLWYYYITETVLRCVVQVALEFAIFLSQLLECWGMPGCLTLILCILCCCCCCCCCCCMRQGLLHITACPGTHYVDQVGLELLRFAYLCLSSTGIEGKSYYSLM